MENSWTCAVEVGEPVANVGEADAPAKDGAGIHCAETRPGVGNFQDEVAVFASRRDGNVHGLAAGLHAVAERVFEQRLQDQLRHK